MNCCALGEPDRVPFLVNMSINPTTPAYWCIICGRRAEWNGKGRADTNHHFHPSTSGFGPPTKHHAKMYLLNAQCLSTGDDTRVRTCLETNLNLAFTKAVAPKISGARWSSQYIKHIINACLAELKNPGSFVAWKCTDFPNYGFEVMPQFFQSVTGPAPRPTSRPVDRLFTCADAVADVFIPKFHDRASMVEVPKSYLRDVHALCVENDHQQQKYRTLQREFIEYKLQSAVPKTVTSGYASSASTAVIEPPVARKSGRAERSRSRPR